MPLLLAESPVRVHQLALEAKLGTANLERTLHPWKHDREQDQSQRHSDDDPFPFYRRIDQHSEAHQRKQI
jgi:hypothetical protein